MQNLQNELIDLLKEDETSKILEEDKKWNKMFYKNKSF